MTNQKVTNARQVEAFKPDPARRQEIADALYPGLYLVVQPTGKKSWAVRYRVRGKPRKFTLGSYPAISLAKARELAGKSQGAVAEARDPAKEKQRATKDQVPARVREFLARHASRNRRQAEIARHFNVYVLPEWGDRSVHEITRADVIELLDKIADGKINHVRMTRDGPKPVKIGRPVMANRVLATVRKFFNWLVARDVLAVPPTHRVEAPAPERRRDRVLNDGELVEVWQAAEAVGWPFGHLVRLLLLTAARREEIAAAKWSQIDLRQATLTIPADRYKTGVPHMIPLSDGALQLLRELPVIDGADWLFPSFGRRRKNVAAAGDDSAPEFPDSHHSGFAKSKAVLDRIIRDRRAANAVRAGTKAEPMAPWTLHDLRRTARTNLSRLKVPPHVAELVLGHAVPGIRAVYDLYAYADEKRAALDAWQAYMTELVTPPPTSNVVTLRGATSAAR